MSALVKDELTQSLSELNKEKAKIKDRYMEYIKNKDIHIFNRWRMFTCLGDELGDKNCFMLHFRKLDGSEYGPWVDYRQRYETVDLTTIFEEVEFCGTEDEFECSLEYVGAISKEDLFHIMEQILQSGYSSFEFDW